MSEVLPLFKSHYSIGRSILTLENDEGKYPNYPDSIIDICKDNGIKKFTLVDDNMNGFLQAYSSSKDSKLDLCFGIRIGITDDCEEKSEDSMSKTCKYVIFAKNSDGYKSLIEIYSYAAKVGFYYVPRLDFKTLKKFWKNKDLLLCIPFYDSFIFRNSLEYSACVPELDFTSPTFFLENNNLPFDNILRKRVLDFCKDNYQTQESKSIYYKNKDDFKSYLTFRCINNRTTLNKPEFRHMSSDEFSFESWKKVGL